MKTKMIFLHAIIVSLLVSSVSLFAMEPGKAQESATFTAQDLQVEFKYEPKKLETYLTHLQLLANGLLYQAHVMKLFKGKVENLQTQVEVTKKHHHFEMENNIFTSEWGVLRFSSWQVLSIVLRHPKLFHGLAFYSAASIPDEELPIGEFKSYYENHISNVSKYSHIASLVREWLVSDDEQVRKVAEILDLELCTQRVAYQDGKTDNMLIDYLERYSKGSHQYLKPLIRAESGFTKEQLTSLGKVIDWLPFYGKVGGDPSLCLEPAVVTLSHYKNVERSLSELYLCIVAESNNLIKQQDRPKQRELFKYGKTLSYNQGTLMAVAQANFPGSLPLVDEGEAAKMSTQSTTQEDDIVALQRKRAELQKKKAAQKAQKRKKSAAKGSRKKDTKQTPEQAPKKQVVAAVVKAQLNKAPTQAFDGSILQEETSDYLDFHDPKNKLKVRVLKSDEVNVVSWPTEKIKALTMTDWVKAWYENSEQAFTDQGYTDPESFKYALGHDKQRVIINHSPPAILLQHIKNLAKQGEAANQRTAGRFDTLFTMPVVYFYQDRQVEQGRNWESGVVAWLVDSDDNSTIYHTEFRPITVSRMIQDYSQKGFFEISFPTLQETISYQQKSLSDTRD